MPRLVGPSAAAAVVEVEALEPVSSEESGSIHVGESVVPIASAADIVLARTQGRALAAGLGFSACDQTVIATAISELARNILEFANVGRIAMTPVQIGTCLGVVIEARDEGPGIADLARVLEGAYSTPKGPGFGLPGVKRLMDEFDIASELGRGTTVTAKKWQFAGARGMKAALAPAAPVEHAGKTQCPTAL